MAVQFLYFSWWTASFFELNHDQMRRIFTNPIKFFAFCVNSQCFKNTILVPKKIIIIITIIKELNLVPTNDYIHMVMSIWRCYRWSYCLVFFKRKRTQMWWIFEQHLSHQITRNGPGLKFPCLFPNELAEPPIIVLRPLVFQQPGLGKLNGSSCEMWSSTLDAGSSEKP